MIETLLEFVAEMIDAKLQVCDDGYVLCMKNTLHTDYKGKKKEQLGIDIIFNRNGKFEGIQKCR